MTFSVTICENRTGISITIKPETPSHKTQTVPFVYLSSPDSMSQDANSSSELTMCVLGCGKIFPLCLT